MYPRTTIVFLKGKKRERGDRKIEMHREKEQSIKKATTLIPQVEMELNMASTR
jgi:hypothetical protein